MYMDGSNKRFYSPYIVVKGLLRPMLLSIATAAVAVAMLIAMRKSLTLTNIEIINIKIENMRINVFIFKYTGERYHYSLIIKTRKLQSSTDKLINAD